MNSPKPSRPLFCEIITIGTELLLGQILDTNTAYVAREMARTGIGVRFRTCVGDHLDEMCLVLRQALDRCDLIITTGGLGPTLDDLTRQAVAEIAGVSLEFREDLMGEIEAIFARYGYGMPENNRRQAYIPEGSHAISNPVGTAPAFIAEVRGRPIICLPGVPRELSFLMENRVVPWLRKRFEIPEQTVFFRVLKVIGIGESTVDQLIGDLIRPGENPEIGLLASQGEIKIRVAALGSAREHAGLLVEPVILEIRKRLGNKIFGEDEETLEGVLTDLLSRQDLSLAICETFSGGLAIQRLMQPPFSRVGRGLVISSEADLNAYVSMDQVLLPEERALLTAEKVCQDGESGVGLAIVGFLEKREKDWFLKACSAAKGAGFQKTYSWEMGGDLSTLQVRGAAIGLNTLRLALLERASTA